jgi:hypothetical protein
VHRRFQRVNLFRGFCQVADHSQPSDVETPLDSFFAGAERGDIRAMTDNLSSISQFLQNASYEETRLGCPRAFLDHSVVIVQHRSELQ